MIGESEGRYEGAVSQQWLMLWQFGAHLCFSVMLKGFCKWLVYSRETDTSRSAYTTISHKLATVYSYMLKLASVSVSGLVSFMSLFPQKVREHSLGLYLVFCLSCRSLQVVSAWTSLSTSCHSALNVGCLVMPCIFRKVTAPLLCVHITSFLSVGLLYIGWHSAVEWNTAVSLINAFGAWRHKHTQPVLSVMISTYVIALIAYWLMRPWQWCDVMSVCYTAIVCTNTTSAKTTSSTAGPWRARPAGSVLSPKKSNQG